MDLRDALRIPAADVTPEDVWKQRRRLVAGLAALPALGIAGCAEAEPPLPPAPTPAPAQVQDGFSTDEEPTRWEDATSYNNFYEFGPGKSDPVEYAGALQTTPWTVRIEGAVHKPLTLGLRALSKPALMMFWLWQRKRTILPLLFRKA